MTETGTPPSSHTSRFRSVAFITTVLAVIAIVIALGAWIWPDPFGWADNDKQTTTPSVATTSTSTAITQFDPGLISPPASTQPLLAAACGSSMRSNRSDASACVDMGGMFHDPCFVRYTSAMCPYRGGSSSTEVAWLEVTTKYPTLINEQRNHSAEATVGWPWGMELEDGTQCFWEITPPGGATKAPHEPAYTCGRFAALVGNTKEFFTSENRKIVSLKWGGGGEGRAIAPERATLWTVRYAPTGNAAYQTTAVKNVWF